LSQASRLYHAPRQPLWLAQDIAPLRRSSGPCSQHARSPTPSFDVAGTTLRVALKTEVVESDGNGLSGGVVGTDRMGLDGRTAC